MTSRPSIDEVIARVRELDEKATPAPALTRYGHGGGRAWTGTALEPGRTLVADYYNEGDREFYHAARTLLPRLAKVVEIAVGRLRLHTESPAYEDPEIGTVGALCTYCSEEWPCGEALALSAAEQALQEEP